MNVNSLRFSLSVTTTQCNKTNVTHTKLHANRTIKLMLLKSSGDELIKLDFVGDVNVFSQSAICISVGVQFHLLQQLHKSHSTQLHRHCCALTRTMPGYSNRRSVERKPKENGSHWIYTRTEKKFAVGKGFSGEKLWENIAGENGGGWFCCAGSPVCLQDDCRLQACWSRTLAGHVHFICVTNCDFDPVIEHPSRNFVEICLPGGFSE